MNRFWDKVDIRGPDECWPWKGVRSKRGYGQFRISKPKRTMAWAHRMAYELATGDLLGRRFGLHSCDNPPCCNPSHVFPGDHDDNMTDMKKKGRARTVDQALAFNHNAKLSSEDVDIVRVLIANGKTNTEIGSIFGVSHATISAIRRGITWKARGG